MADPNVIILMGSKADESHGNKIALAARELGLTPVLRVASAHKTPAHALKLLREYEEGARPRVYITVAGRSNALSGFVDGAVTAPVIACPPASETFGGADIFSSIRMPSGIAPAVVLEPGNAALFAAKILGLTDPAIRDRVVESQKRQANKIEQDDSAMKGVL